MGSTFEEHLEYISDPTRTDLYRRAIAESVRPGDVVVDLGCGFGLLGILCLQAGAGRVWGIDQTEAIEIAREVAARAGFGDRYHCVRGRSFDVSLPELADVVICDHVGFFGFDYGIIAALADARQRFLKPGGTLIPGRIELYIAGIASERCEETATAWRSPDIPPEFHWLSDYGVNSKYSKRFEEGEIATADKVVATVDFLSATDALLTGTGIVEATKDGHLNGLGGWFRASLSPNVMMSNAPRGSDSIRRDQLFLPFEHPMPIRAGDAIDVEIKARHDSNVLSWMARNQRTGDQRFQTSWRSKILPGRESEPAS